MPHFTKQKKLKLQQRKKLRVMRRKQKQRQKSHNTSAKATTFVASTDQNEQQAKSEKQEDERQESEEQESEEQESEDQEPHYRKYAPTVIIGNVSSSLEVPNKWYEAMFHRFHQILDKMCPICKRRERNRKCQKKKKH